MKYVNANDTTHTIKLILREEISEVDFILYNEFRQTTETITNTIATSNGITTLTFDYEFTDGDSFQFTLSDENVVYYRGKIKAIL